MTPFSSLHTHKDTHIARFTVLLNHITSMTVQGYVGHIDIYALDLSSLIQSQEETDWLLATIILKLNHSWYNKQK